ncbi:glycosyltransferase family 2 protein [bacterium]|nr:glycosyltransferase family 2 protein [bacterium]
MPHPIVSILMPTYNEGATIEDVVRSLLQQNLTGYGLEILIIDGMSTDDTREIITTRFANDKRVRLVDNPQRFTPHAANIGLFEANGDYICFFGAHGYYDPEYIQICLEEMESTGAVGVSGRLETVPANDSLQAQLVAWAISHPFGASGASVRTQPEGFADTIPYPVFRKQALLEIGGYNETLVRNQDNDMNQRLIAAGHKLYLTHRTTARYFSKPTIWGLLRYAHKSGWWNAISLKVNWRSMRLRHHVPTLFVLSVLAWLPVLKLGKLLHWKLAIVKGRILGLALPAHLLAGATFAWNEYKKTGRLATLLLPPVWLAFHFAYGFGTLHGLCKARVPDPDAEGQR